MSTTKQDRAIHTANHPNADQKEIAHAIDLWAKEKIEKKMVSLNVRVPESLRDDFKNLCDSKGIEMSEVIRRMLEREIAVNS